VNVTGVRRGLQELVRNWLLANLPLLRQSTPPRGAHRLTLWIVRRVLSVLDRRFERQFRALLDHSVPPYATHRHRPLLIASIGTLGPGGAERQLVNTLLGLKRRYEIDIEVVAMSLEKESERFFLETLERAGITVSRIDRNRGLAAPEDVAEEEEAQRLRHALRAHLHPDLDHVSAYTSLFLARRPDVVHLWLDTVNTKGGLAAALAGVPRIVLGMRNVNPSHFVFYQPYMRAAYRCLLEVAQVVAVNNSEVGARDYAEWIGIDAGRISVVRNGLDFDGAAAARAHGDARAYRARWNIPASAEVLGGMMRLSEEKRPLLWVQVAESVATRCSEVHFLLVGDGVQRPLVEARIAASPFASRFHLVGYERNPYVSLLGMDLLFLSSILEGSPNVLIEAQAVGVPVVTMPAAGAVEALDDGRTGWVVHDGSAASAAERITYVLTHPHVRAAAADAAPDWVRTRFGLERMIAETAATYGNLDSRLSDTLSEQPCSDPLVIDEQRFERGRK
jgi:glycosyltransferase involved in cell wall biosynthesis